MTQLVQQQWGEKKIRTKKKSFLKKKIRNTLLLKDRYAQDHTDCSGLFIYKAR